MGACGNLDHTAPVVQIVNCLMTKAYRFSLWFVGQMHTIDQYAFDLLTN